MKAYVFHGHGRAGLEEVAKPQPGPGEVRLRVAATALNHLDVFGRTGTSGPGIRQHHYPHVSGVDVSGVVDVAGAGDFDAAMAMVLGGRLKPVIHAVYSLERTGEALDELEAARQFGKIVIEPAARGGG